ncbi:hypothetical protein AJ79_09485 [Helicocarpus griseus UAMH5409]|uniref:Major facilitator superfamily (MFS) profile domain-containing protein n=1 Tax=Helicocarpus griseus UAMH5409 TaxID=1447875 RepID=A0A2B7WIZ0_9EURO|nr:hypothetical protein AJ79_09485 [Helicocarpus griseus UAMH5409]
MPQMAILYLLAYLDRSNLGNAKLQGLVEEALNANDDHYGWAASIFYFGYIACAIPFTLYGKKFHPSRFMFVCVLGWGIAATGAAGAFNFGGLAAARFFIGLFEAGFAPSAVFYLTIWYPRSEIVFRTSLFVGMAALSAEENPKVALVGIFFLLAGVFPCIPLEVQWATDNCGAESKKPAAISFMVVCGHCWSILASKSFPDSEGPRFVRGYSIVLSFLCLSTVMTVVLHIRHRIVNAKRDKLYGKPNILDQVDTSELADEAPMFRYVI